MPTTTHRRRNGSSPARQGHHDLDVVAIGSPLLDVIELATGEQLAHGTGQGIDDPDRPGEGQGDPGPHGAPRHVSGGSVANTTAGIAELGGTAGFVGTVADDEVGHTYAENLRAAGVEFEPHYSERSGDGLGTGRCVVLITEDADRTMGTYLGAASTLTPAGVPDAFVARASIVLLEGYLWDVPAAKEAMRHAAATAHAGRRLGGPVPVGPLLCEPPPARVPGPATRRRRHPSRQRGGAHDALRRDSADAAIEVAEETGLLVVMTRGPQGAVVLTARGPVAVPAAPVDQVIDTTGAGDLFAAGFFFGLTHGMGPEESTRLGGLCAAEVISHTGARPEADLKALAKAAGLFSV